jgi:WD40 repeat protein
VSQSVSLRSTNRGLAALLAVEAYRRRPDAAARAALLATFTGSPGFVGYQYLPAQHQVTGALVPGSTKAVVALDGRDLRVLDLATGRLDARFPPPPAGTLNDSVLRVSADGRYVAQLAGIRDAGAASALSVYQINTGGRVFGPLRTRFLAGDVALNEDGSLVAVAGGPGGDLAVYRRTDAQLVGTVPGLGRPAGVDLTRSTAAVVFDAAGRLYLGSMAGPIRVTDPATMRVLDSFAAPLLSSNNQLLVTPSGLLVAAGDEAVVALDRATGTTRWTTKRQRGSNAGSAIAVAAGRLYCLSVFSTGSSANLGRVGRLEERDLATGLPTGVVLDPQQGTVGDLAVTTDGRELVTFSHNAPVLSEWRLDGTGPITTRVGQGWIGSAYDPTGTRLLVLRYASSTLFQGEQGRPGTPSVWDPAADRIIDPLHNVGAAAWAGPPGRVVAVFPDGTIGFYDLPTRSRVKGVAIGSLGRPIVTHTSADSTRLYIAYQNGRLQTIDSRAGRLIGTLQLDGPPSSIASTADGTRLITTTNQNGTWSMTVRDATTGRKLGQVPNINTTQIGPGNTLVAANIVGDITQYDLRSLKPLGTFPGARGLVAGLQFSHDGKVLTAVSQDRTVSIYDTDSRTRLGDPIPLKVPRQGASLRPDGAAVAVGTGDGLAIWDLNPQHLAAAACRLAGRNLTTAEWDSYLASLGRYRPTCPYTG